MRRFGMVPLAMALAITVGFGTAVWAQGAWKAPADAKATKNPVKGIGNAKKAVETNCVTCHGASGKGDTEAAKALPPPKPADWTSAKVQAETDGELFWKITNGRGTMPAWKGILSDTQRWEVVNYIRTLKGK